MPRKRIGVGDKVFVPMEDGTVGMYEITGTLFVAKDRNGDESNFDEEQVYGTLKAASEYLSDQFTTLASPKPRRGRPKKQVEQIPVEQEPSPLTD